MRLANPDVPSPVLCLAGARGVGKSTLARQLAAALGRACAWLPCGGLGSAAALHGARSGPPGRIVEELRRVGVRNPVFVVDEVDRLDEAGGAAAALLEALDPAPGAAFRDRYLDVGFDLSEALFVATAASPGRAPTMLRERMTVVELPGYTEAEKRVIATGHLLPLQLARHGLTAEQVQVTGEAVGALIRGYTREPGVWGLAGTLGELCGKLVRRRAEGNEAPVEVTPQTLVEMLGAPAEPDVEAASHARRPGVAAGLCCTAAGGGEVIVVEASRLPGSGALTLTGRQGEVMRESARTAQAWLRVNAARYGLDPDFQRDTDVHLHVQSAEIPKEGASAGVTMAAALVSAFTRRPVRADVAMTGEITLGGQVLPVGGIAEKVLAAHRGGLAHVILPRQNRTQVDSDLGDDLRHVVVVDYVTQVDEMLELALRPTPAAGSVAAGHAGRPRVLSRPGASRRAATRTSSQQHDLLLHARPAARRRNDDASPNPNTTSSNASAATGIAEPIAENDNLPHQETTMRNHNQPCCVTIPGHDPNRRRVQPQTRCAGRNRVTIRILGADRVRTHVFRGPSALADAAETGSPDGPAADAASASPPRHPFSRNRRTCASVTNPSSTRKTGSLTRLWVGPRTGRSRPRQPAKIIVVDHERHDKQSSSPSSVREGPVRSEP